jgi:growth factor-regulated tyrosine kinase substrate
MAEEEEDAEEVKVDAEIDTFIEDVKKTLELYINRMKSDSMRGRSITNDTAVQSLFLQLQHLQPKLMSYIKYKEDARAYYENLQDKLTQLKDAREALNALRHENYEKKRKEMEEKERIRQIQLAQKLQAMRQQKQSYYLYQNELNLQRLQEQERDLQMRLSQQRELVLQRDTQLFSPSFPVAGGIPGMAPTPQVGQYVPQYPNLQIQPQLSGVLGDVSYAENKLQSLQYQQQVFANQQPVGYQQQWPIGQLPQQQIPQQLGTGLAPAGPIQIQPPAQQFVGINGQQIQQPVQQQQQFAPNDAQVYYNGSNQLNQQAQFQQQQVPLSLQQQQPPQQQTQAQQYAQNNQSINNSAEGQLITFD